MSDFERAVEVALKTCAMRTPVGCIDGLPVDVLVVLDDLAPRVAAAIRQAVIDAGAQPYASEAAFRAGDAAALAVLRGDAP